MFIHVKSSEVQLTYDDLLFYNRLAVVWVEMNRQSIYHQSNMGSCYLNTSIPKLRSFLR